ILPPQGDRRRDVLFSSGRSSLDGSPDAHETANLARAGDAKPTGLSESAGLPKEVKMRTRVLFALACASLSGAMGCLAEAGSEDESPENVATVFEPILGGVPAASYAEAVP